MHSILPFSVGILYNIAGHMFETTCPSMQAADLRYIMEAPKLQLSPEERVQIPVLTDIEANRYSIVQVVFFLPLTKGVHTALSALLS